MSGLEILGGVAASVQLVDVIQSSLRFLGEARNASKHASEQRDMHFHLVVQAIQFEGWCAAIKIPNIICLKEANPNTWQDSQEFVDLRRRLGTDLRFGNGSIADLTLKTLGGLKVKFEIAWDLLQGYRSPPGDNLVLNPSEHPREKKRWYQRSTSSFRKDLKGAEAVTVGQKNIVAGVKWAGIDKIKFSTLLDEIRALNASLLLLLGPDQQERVQRQSLIKILDDPGTSTLSRSSSGEDSELVTLANLQSLQDTYQGSDARLPAAPTPYHLHMYSRDDFESEVIKLGDTRSWGQLDNEKVLVEWKYYSKEKPGLRQITRLTNLVGLLNHNSLLQKFLAPKCKGLVDDPLNSRIGIIYRTSKAHAEKRAKFEYLELQKFVRSTPTMPSVGERFQIGKKLATAMSNLHSVHWLHKSFRSDNIVFLENPTSIAQPPSPDGDIVRNPTQMGGLGALSPTPSPLPQLFIIGWDLSRPDSPSELSESISLSSASFQNKRENMKLYSHPEIHASLLSTNKHSRYRTEFDIYSLGLVLLEIGLWRTLDSMRRKCSSDEDFRRMLRSEYCDKLLPKMGSIYWRATQRCIANDFDLQATDSGEAEDFPLQIAFEKQVVSQLSKCNA